MEYYNFFYFKTAELVGKYLTTIFMEHPNMFGITKFWNP